MDMQVANEDIDAATRAVTVSGELVGSSGTRLVRMVEQALEDSIQRLLVDLTEMTFMDSGGLAALIAAWGVAGQRGVRFAIVLAAESHAQRSFELRGVADVFAVAGTREAALAMLSA